MSSFTDLLAVLGRTEPTIRLGMQQPGGEFTSAAIDQQYLDTVVERAPGNLWFEVNPSSHVGDKGRTSAADVTRLVALWADLDYKEGGLGGETVVLEVIDDLSRAIGSKPAATVHSGGGKQPFWVISDGDITDENRARVAGILKRWGVLVKRFAAEHGGTADSVYDLPRILRVPGTKNWKYDPPRPVDVTFRDKDVTYTLDEIAEMLDDWGVVDIETDAGIIVSPFAEWEWADEDCRFARQLHDEIIQQQVTARHPWALAKATQIFELVREGGCTEPTFLVLQNVLAERLRALASTQQPTRDVSDQELNGLFAWARLKAQQVSNTSLADDLGNHVHESFEVMLAADMAARPDALTLQPVAGTPNSPDLSLTYATPTTSDAATLPDAPTTVAPSNQAASPTPSPASGGTSLRDRRSTAASLTDVGNAERLGKRLLGHFIYVPGIGWHEFTGGRYQPQAEPHVMEMAKDVATTFMVTAPTKEAASWGKKSLSAGLLASSIKLASSLPELEVQTDELDAKPYEINTPGGIIDLRNGKLRDADPKTDFHTYRTAVTPDFDTEPVKWNEFLHWALRGDAAMIAYMQRLAGLALIGNADAQVFPIWVGVGANGKSTITGIWLSLMADYGIILPQKYFVVRNGNDHPTEIAQLRGIRFAVSSEVPQGAKFDEEKVKNLTGERSLRGRFMGQNFFSFPNQTLHVMTVNHLPEVEVGGPSFFRRIRLVDFHNHLAEHEQDPMLPQRLVDEEGPAILAWMARGAAAVLAGGEQVPFEVAAATQRYKYEEDVMERFVTDKLRRDDATESYRSAIFDTYRTWCRAEGVDPLDRMKFEREMALHVEGSVRVEKPDMFVGVTLKPVVFAEDPAEMPFLPDFRGADQ